MSRSGQASRFSLGCQLVSTTNARDELNCTSLDSRCITGGSANKLQINDVPVTTTSLSGTNLVSGVMV